MPTTPIYSLRYLALTDPPNLASATQNLATDVENTIGATVAQAAGAWNLWVPTLTNLTLGSGTLIGKYRQVGKTVDYRFKFRLGAGSVVASSPRFSPPVAPHADYVADEDRVGSALLADVGIGFYDGIVYFRGPGIFEIAALGAAGATVSITPVTATTPFTWGGGDALSAFGTYEAA